MKAIALIPLLLNLATFSGSAADALCCSGITVAFHDVTLSASVPGIVNRWKFKEGDFVKEAEVIVELDKNLEELEVARRKLVMDVRKNDWEALRTLVNKSSISVKKEELEKAEADYRVAVIEHDIAAEQLRRRLIVAPYAGCIAEITRDPGEACQAYQPLVRLVDTRRCYLVANLEAKQAARLKLQQKMKLEVECGSAPVTFEGKVSFLSPVVDPASGLQEVKVLFENPDRAVRPGIAGKLFLE
jgi:membrane fusion protein, multidrug efflux system